VARVTQAAGAPRRGRAVLTREQILDAALALADREGLENVSMRRLAEEVGAGTMTLYTYFRDKEELLDAAVDQAAARLAAPPAGGTWQSRLRGLVKEMHRSLVEHPSGVELRRTRPILTPAALRTTEAGMRILIDAGFSPGEAARSWRSLFIYTFGSAQFTPADVPAATRREWRRHLEGLPAEEFPALTAAAGEAVETMSGEAQFDHGLDRLVRGLAADLEARA
jgi:AcrR family transcriptional regulator